MVLDAWQLPHSQSMVLTAYPKKNVYGPAQQRKPRLESDYKAKMNH